MQIVTLAIMAPTLNLCNYLFGIDRGYFRAEDLEVNVIVRPGMRNVEAVLSGEADFGAANECVIQKALLGPTALRIVLQALNDPLHDLLLAKGLNEVADLRGRKLAVPAAGSTPEIQTRRFLRKFGLEPDKDVFVVPQSPPDTMEDRIRKFEEGVYSGLISSPPTPFMLHAKGYRTVTELSEHFPGTASHGLVTLTNTISKRRPIVEAMARAYTRGVMALKADRAAGVEFVATRFKLDAALAARCYDLLRDRWTAGLSLPALRTECEFHAANAGVAAIAPESITDSTFIMQAE